MIYQIRIKGLLDHQWTDWFGGMTVSATDDGDTLLTGPVEDQAALHGLLKKVRDWGMPLEVEFTFRNNQSIEPPNTHEEERDDEGETDGNETH